jgi:hypothetical protein
MHSGTVGNGNHSEGEANGGTFENMTMFLDETGDSFLRQTVRERELNL